MLHSNDFGRKIATDGDPFFTAANNEDETDTDPLTTASDSAFSQMLRAKFQRQKASQGLTESIKNQIRNHNSNPEKA